MLVAAGHDLVEALGVGDHLRGVQRGAHVLDELVHVLDRGRVAGLVEDLAGGLALLGVARDAAGEGGLGDAGHRYAEVERALHRPPAGALLLGGVGDHVDERLAGGVLVLQHGGGQLDQEGVEVALVPLAEDPGELGRLLGEHVAQDVVGLGDQLHVGVLDAVVHHLHEVTRTVRTDVGGAGGAVDLGGDVLHDRAERLVGVLGAAHHDRRTVERALLAAGDTHPDEVQALLLQRLLPSQGVLEVRVARVDDDVALVEQRHELVDDGVGGLAGLDHDDDRARLLDAGDEVLHGLRADEVAVVTVLVEERRHPLGGAVVHRDRVSVPGDVAGEVAAHHGQPGEADVCRRVRSAHVLDPRTCR